jgi:hypothetical protein
MTPCTILVLPTRNSRGKFIRQSPRIPPGPDIQDVCRPVSWQVQTYSLAHQGRPIHGPVGMQVLETAFIFRLLIEPFQTHTEVLWPRPLFLGDENK